MTQITLSCPKSCKTYCKARQLQQAFSQQGPFHSNETPETKAFFKRGIFRRKCCFVNTCKLLQEPEPIPRMK